MKRKNNLPCNQQVRGAQQRFSRSRFQRLFSLFVDLQNFPVLKQLEIQIAL